MLDTSQLATRSQERPGSFQAIALVGSGDSWVTDSSQSLPPPAPICNPYCGQIQMAMTGRICRSKFNTALGIEAQGFCYR